MKYSDGNEIKIGDWVKLWDNCYGIVVCLLENNEYSNGYPENRAEIGRASCRERV